MDCGERGEGARGMAFWGGGERGMNHRWRAGNKVHFLSRQTISQEIRPSPPDINLHGGNLALPGGGRGGRGKCFHLNGSIYHSLLSAP